MSVLSSRYVSPQGRQSTHRQPAMSPASASTQSMRGARSKNNARSCNITVRVGGSEGQPSRAKIECVNGQMTFVSDETQSSGWMALEEIPRAYCASYPSANVE